jgi:hypothetical protein
MGLVLDGGVWKLQADGSNVTEVTQRWSAASGTPSSIADGATLDASMFNGWKVKDANGGFKTISDDGTTCDIVVDNATGDSEISTGNVWLTNPRLYYDTPLMADFEVSFRFDSDAAMGSAITQFALMVGGGDASAECHGVAARFGRWQTTNGRNTAYYLVDTGGTNESAGDAVAWTTAREIQVKRVQDTITVSKRVGEGDSWTAYSTQKLDVVGGGCIVSLVFYAATNGEKFRFYSGRLSGFQYTANP